MNFIPNFMFLVDGEACRHNVSWISTVWAVQHWWRHNINAKGDYWGESLKVSVYLFTTVLVYIISCWCTSSQVLRSPWWGLVWLQTSSTVWWWVFWWVFEPPVRLFCKTSLETYRFSLFYPSLCKNTWFLERVEGPWWPWLQRQGLCVGGPFCTHPPTPPSACCVWPPTSRAVQIKCQHGDRNIRVPSNTRWIEKLTTSEKVIKKRGRRAGEDKQREGNKQEPRWRYFSPTQSTNTQSCTTAAWRQEQRPCCATRTDVGKKGWKDKKRRGQICDFTKIKHRWKESYTETEQRNKTRSYVHVWLKRACEANNKHCILKRTFTLTFKQR